MRDDRPTWLLFTKSAGYEHSVIKQAGNEPTYLFTHLEPLFAARGIRLVESKDGRLLEPGASGRYAGYVFYTTLDITTEGTDKQPPMSAAGLEHLLGQIEDGTPFIGLHCAADTFHADPPSAFTKMLGGEFDAHGEQQVATAKRVDPNFHALDKFVDWTVKEEWYAFKNLAADIRPIQTIETRALAGKMYARDAYPITWTRSPGKSRIFYTGIGHREDVIASEPYQQLIGGAIDWCLAK